LLLFTIFFSSLKVYILLQFKIKIPYIQKKIK